MLPLCYAVPPILAQCCLTSVFTWDLTWHIYKTYYIIGESCTFVAVFFQPGPIFSLTFRSISVFLFGSSSGSSINIRLLLFLNNPFELKAVNYGCARLSDFLASLEFSLGKEEQRAKLKLPAHKKFEASALGKKKILSLFFETFATRATLRTF